MIRIRSRLLVTTSLSLLPVMAAAQSVVATGNVTPSSPTSWTSSTSINVGYNTPGSLTISDGGRVVNGAGYVGVQGGTGQVTVTGDGSRWESNGYLYVGANGTGIVTIANGGFMSSAGTVIGRSDLASGSVTVTGEGSTWVDSYTIIVGFSKNGRLTIADGGTVSSNFGRIGEISAATGFASVTGDGSRWNNSNYLKIGYQARGSLTIGDGGLVTVGALLGDGSHDGTATVADSSGSNGTVSIGAAEGDAAVAAGTLDAARLVFGAGNGTLVFNHTDDDYNFQAAISGNGTIRHLAGTTTLLGDSSAFSGTTAVTGGGLMLADGALLGGAI
ncbi:hypothetical protein J5J09_22555, partial [Ciceribacter sp. L1K22]|nr:hypothetical protein [Ciceribacter sp. L1K22]